MPRRVARRRGQGPPGSFWMYREPYDRGTTTHMFWSGLLRAASPHHPAARFWASSAADTNMWTTTDPAGHRDPSSGPCDWNSPAPVVQRPRLLADALDATAWAATLFSRTVYSAHPGTGAYEAALIAAGHPRPARTLFVDDRLDNAEAAARLGLRTAHYTGNAAALARCLPRPRAITVPSVAAGG